MLQKERKRRKKWKPLDKNDEKNEEPEWREVVMDLLLSLISKEESFWRKVATVIFMNICHKIKPSVLSLLTDVINPEKDEPILEGKTNEDSMNQSSVDYEDLDDPDTSMEVDTEEMSESEEELDESEGDEDEEKDDDDEDKIGMINLKKEMQEVVGLPLESVELDSVPEEELENLDKKLGSLINKYVALSNKRKKKIKFSKDETALMCFRTRVCDLLEILVKEAPSLDHILQVIKPILMAINNSLEDKLQIHFLKKLRSLIVEVSQVKKFGKPTSVSPEELATYLNDIFAMANEFSNLMKAEINYCCTFLVRSQQYLNISNKKESNVVMKAYADYLEKAFSETSSEIYDGPIHLETVSLEMVLKVLAIVIFKKNTRPFNKKKGLEMLKEILNNENAVNKMTSKNLKVVLQTILRETVTAFDRVQQTKHVQSNYLTMLIEILKTVKKVFKSNPEIEDLLEWEKVINSVTNFCQRISLKDFKTLKKIIQSLTNINNFQAESCKEEKSNSAEDGDAKAAQKEKISKKSKKKRKLEELEEKDREESNAEKEVGEETLNEEGNKEEKVEEENEQRLGRYIRRKEKEEKEKK
ncbi:Myb-binding protein 1A [Armadillidium nasatum]|uniref:Myb-binding protein 1A n=1 Tax=Armadillidium nasatum TaxID=96803 RepID=A0A5N5TMJ6_9CRUS|nr:Myb-binding protein 1A [Armadillidium nasatum]